MRSLFTALALAATALVAVPATAANAATGIHVSGTKILEGSGQEFVMRGTSHAHTWYATQTKAFADIKSLKANTVRVVLSGGRWSANSVSDVANVVSLCKQNKLICVLEDHDTTGYGEQSGAYTLDQAANYWISVKSALVGQEDYVVINIGNEPIGNNATTPGWADATKAAIQKLRTNGFDHALMVDAPAWGQDWQNVMRDNATSVFNADPDKNTIFSVHMYGVYDTAAEITSYMDAFKTAGLPLVVGEFGFNHSDGNPDEDTIMAQAVSRGLGYLGWSWSGNGGGVEYLDQVTNFDVTQLTSWGQRLFNGANGIAATAKQAAIYGGTTTDPTPPSTPGTPSASNVTSSGATLTWTASTDNVGVTGYDVYTSTGTPLGATATNSITLTGLSASTPYQVYVKARDAAGNQSSASPTASFTTLSGGGGGGCTATGTAQSQWNGGYVLQPVTVTNTGTSAKSGWTVTFTLPAGHTLTGSWNAAVTVSGQTVTAKNLSYNGTLGAGASTSFGLQASRPNGDTSVPSGYTCAG
ncbi:MAG: cellulase family glycosylhydrolase [Nonomuraea sp.]|nr:cellulase family glycosylhydrolase [Nonomuraea sp.]NUP61293.1 cellulase family glycosylhydrolase [Nonomuraea sp.]NUP83544.1 cellulase family glycosylhydrolase [Nonomuraea sp.]NUS02154.1 cellulase family glycosylhydrolase [Nonomuraea sp.]NUT11206.1 cellulase family glycosylhydrolase [Nonomuraea sp.]